MNRRHTIAVAFVALTAADRALAQVTDNPRPAGSQQDQVLNAINNSVSSSSDPFVLYCVLGGILVVLFGVAFYQRYYKPNPATGRKFLRNPKKLMREAARELRLSSADVKKLRHHAERLEIEHPLTLLLCPSLLKKGEEQATTSKPLAQR